MDQVLAQVDHHESLVEVPAFYVTVTLTNQAQQRLDSAGETIVVSASLDGEAQPNASLTLDDVGRVDLGNYQHELTGAGRTTNFSQLHIPASTVSQLVSRDYSVNVNVFSGRRSTQANLLSCDFFDGKLSDIQPGITLRCGLIGEYESQVIDTSNHSIRKISPQ